MSESFKQKAKDFLVLYEAFLEFIDGKYLTTESLLAKLNEVLGDSTIVRDSVIVLDGFTGFTPIQYQLVELKCIVGFGNLMFPMLKKLS